MLNNRSNHIVCFDNILNILGDVCKFSVFWTPPPLVRIWD